MGKHMINDNKRHFEELLLFPDYASSGLWCSCGLGLGNPKEEFKIVIPDGLIDTIDLWNSYWEDCDDAIRNGKMNREYCQIQINATGHFLADLLSEYIPCDFLEERSKLYPYK